MVEALLGAVIGGVVMAAATYWFAIRRRINEQKQEVYAQISDAMP